MATQEIRASFMYEILGKPPEYIKETLEKFVNDFDGKTGIKLISKKVHEPKLLEREPKEEPNKTTEQPVKATQELYTTFAEVELEIDNLDILFKIVLNTLPANVEILEPSSLTLKNFDLSGVLCELAIKLHKFDEVTKALAIERNNLVAQLKEMREKLDQPKLNISTGIKPSEDDESEDDAKHNHPKS
jgi:hypothetical protein